MLKRLSNTCRSAVAPVVVALAFASAGISQPQEESIYVKRVVSMEYPPFARNAALQGIVVLDATVSNEGRVVNIGVVSGPAPLATPAIDTLSRWRFSGCKRRDTVCGFKAVFSFVLSGTCAIGTNCPTEFVADLPDRVEVKSKRWDGPIVN